MAAQEPSASALLMAQSSTTGTAKSPVLFKWEPAYQNHQASTMNA